MKSDGGTEDAIACRAPLVRSDGIQADLNFISKIRKNHFIGNFIPSLEVHKKNFGGAGNHRKSNQSKNHSINQ
jgi:hypothetical protein